MLFRPKRIAAGGPGEGQLVGWGTGLCAGGRGTGAGVMGTVNGRGGLGREGGWDLGKAGDKGDSPLVVLQCQTTIISSHYQ